MFHQPIQRLLQAVPILGLLVVASFASAEIRRGPAICLPCPTPRTCCDDYCPKCPPVIPCPTTNYVCDDYCRKCVPAIPCGNSQFVCNDYCCKPVVCMPKLPCSPWLKCAAPGCTPGSR
nr:hypothetical protein [Pirellula staleyi]